MHVDDPDPPDMLGGLQLTLNPEEGLTEVARLTVPANPFRPVIVTVKVPLEPPLGDVSAAKL